MRRLLSILFTLVLALSPALAAVPAHPLASGWTGKVDESHVPACCRKNGKHHCAMPGKMSGAGKSTDAPITSVSATGCCSGFPSVLASDTAPDPALTPSPSAFLALSEERRITQRRIEVARSSDRRIQPQRGPPSQAL